MIIKDCTINGPLDSRAEAAKELAKAMGELAKALSIPSTNYGMYIANVNEARPEEPAVAETQKPPRPTKRRR